MAVTASEPVPAPVIAGAYGAQGRSEWLDVDWQEHLRWATVAGTPVNYVDVGEGEPVVFVHGLSGCWQNWLENIPHFARSRRVVAMDLPGFGHSPMPREKITISRYAACVDELLDGLGIECANVIGNSMGGFIGAELAIEFSTKVERLVLVSAAGLTTHDMHNDHLMRALRMAEAVLAHGAVWAAKRSDDFARRRNLRRQALAAVVAHPSRLSAPLAAELIRGSGRPGFMDALEALGTYPLLDRLERIECPTLVVWGAKDRLVPARDADRFVESSGDTADKVVYADTGHMAMLERPADFNERVESFLDTPKPEAPQ